jgi:hypothetical protein
MTPLKQPQNRYQYDWLIIILLTVMALSCAWLYRDFAQDDAFITYRYARNIANGHGFVYNLGEPVLGTTTPLYTLTLGLLGKLSKQDIRLISHLISILCLWMSGIVLYYLGKKDGALLAAAVALIFMSNPLLISAIGMETFFLIAILLLTLQNYLVDRLNLTGTLLGLLILTRYETILFAGILGMHFWIQRKQLPIWLIPTAVIFLGWLVFAWYTFGHVIPQSAVAKLTESEGYPFAIGGVIWWRVYVAQTSWYYAFPLLVLSGGYVAFRYKRRPKAYILILAWTGVYFVAASLVAGSFSWYYGPLMPGLSILLGWGIEFLVRLLGATLSRFRSGKFLPQAWQTGIFVVITISLVTLQFSSWTRGWVNYQGRIVDARYDTYREVSDWLNSHANEGESLATGEIGILGYYANMRIVDLRGLVTPALLPWLVRGRTETLSKAIELYAPDYLLTDEEVLIEFLQRSLDYKLVQSFGVYTLWHAVNP